MTRLRAMAPLIVAAALAVVAVVTVQQAGCAEPGHYELGPQGYQLVGGCLAPGDLVVPEPTPQPVPPLDARTPAKS